QMHPSRVRILAVTSAKRNPSLPEVPTLEELGLKDFDVSPWFGVLVPAGTPRPVIDRLAGWFNEINADAQTQQFLARQAAMAFPGAFSGAVGAPVRGSTPLGTRGSLGSGRAP